MERSKKYEDFKIGEIDGTPIGEKNKVQKRSYSFIKLVLLLFLILLISVFYLVFSTMRMKEKKKELEKIKDRKILLDKGTKKLFNVLKNVENTFNTLDAELEQIKKTNLEIVDEIDK